MNLIGFLVLFFVISWTINKVLGFHREIEPPEGGVMNRAWYIMECCMEQPVVSGIVFIALFVIGAKIKLW